MRCHQFVQTDHLQEPKNYANAALVYDWEQWKARHPSREHRKRLFNTSSEPSSQISPSSAPAPTELNRGKYPPIPLKHRGRKIVDSSSEPGASALETPRTPSSSNTPGTVDLETSDLEEPASGFTVFGVETQSDRPEVIVQIDQPRRVEPSWSPTSGEERLLLPSYLSVSPSKIPRPRDQRDSQSTEATHDIFTRAILQPSGPSVDFRVVPDSQGVQGDPQELDSTSRSDPHQTSDDLQFAPSRDKLSAAASSSDIDPERGLNTETSSQGFPESADASASSTSSPPPVEPPSNSQGHSNSQHDSHTQEGPGVRPHSSQIPALAYQIAENSTSSSASPESGEIRPSIRLSNLIGPQTVPVEEFRHQIVANFESSTTKTPLSQLGTSSHVSKGGRSEETAVREAPQTPHRSVHPSSLQNSPLEDRSELSCRRRDSVARSSQNHQSSQRALTRPSASPVSSSSSAPRPPRRLLQSLQSSPTRERLQRQAVLSSPPKMSNEAESGLSFREKRQLSYEKYKSRSPSIRSPNVNHKQDSFASVSPHPSWGNFNQQKASSISSRKSPSPPQQSSVPISQSSIAHKPLESPQNKSLPLSIDSRQYELESSLDDIGVSVLHTQRSGNIELPLPFQSSAQKHYLDLFQYHWKALKAFLYAPPASPAFPTKAEIEAFCQSAFAVTLHQDLGDLGTLTQEEVEPSIAATWATSCSSKFRFMHDLLETARHMDRHVGVFVKHGRALDITEAFMRGMNISYRRPDLHQKMGSDSALKITIFGTDDQSSQKVSDPVDLVIGLDETFDVSNPLVKQMRKDSLHADRQCPAIIPVVAFSIEHVSRNLSHDLGVTERLRKLAQGSLALRSEAGKLPSEIDPRALGKIVGRCLIDPPEGEWPLPPLQPLSIPELGGAETAPQPDQSIDEPAQAKSNKRSMEPTSPDPSATKRPRISPPLDQTPTPNSTTRITDSTAAVPPSTSSANLQPPSQAQAQAQIDTLSAHLTAAQTANAHLQTTLTTRETTISTLQPQVEHLTLQKKHLESQLASLPALTTRTETLQTANDRLKSANQNLTSQLESARVHLRDWTTPANRELEEVRAQAGRVEPLEKKVASVQRDADYFMQQYQAASSAAATHANTITTLEGEVAALTAQASGEQRRLREQFDRREDAAHAQAVRKARSELKIREDVLRRVEGRVKGLEEENERLKARVGMQTRSSSGVRASSVPLEGGGGEARGRRSVREGAGLGVHVRDEMLRRAVGLGGR